jgi:hypothetical protein
LSALSDAEQQGALEGPANAYFAALAAKLIQVAEAGSRHAARLTIQRGGRNSSAGTTTP